MSYIDTISHKRVGTLAGYPVYQPLGTISGKARGAHDFGCTPANLVIGGGSGEHPALVVHRFEQLVTLYLLQVIDWHVQAGGTQTSALTALEDFLLGHLDLKFSEFYEFCGWGIEQTAQFLQAIKDPTLPSPYQSERHSSAEHWLAYSLAEYCLMDAPELLGYTTFADRLKAHFAVCQDLKGYWMGNFVYLSSAEPK